MRRQLQPMGSGRYAWVLEIVSKVRYLPYLAWRSHGMVVCGPTDRLSRFDYLHIMQYLKMIRLIQRP